MAEAEVTRPALGELRFVSTPKYCTVLKMLSDVARNSMLRVSPSWIVLESVMLFWTVPGPVIELRETLPKALPNASGGGWVKAAVLNQFFADPALALQIFGSWMPG